jgi:O-acetyl-ADP-ribose deacetylase (regulator of RNase III)
MLDLESSTLDFRVNVWRSSIQMIEDQPITGVGLDQFLYAYRSRYILPEGWEDPDLSHPHNILLDYWLRLGILGVVVGFAFQIAFWRTTFHAYRRFYETDTLFWALLMGGAGSMAYTLAHGLIDSAHFAINLSYFFAMTLALVQRLTTLRDNTMEFIVNGMIVKLVQGDITDLDVEAITNAANSDLILGAGVAGAIYRKGGHTIQMECNAIGHCDVGKAVLTGGGKLKAKYVIHAVGPRMGEGDEHAKLKSAVHSTLRLAEENSIASVALPAISTGIFGFPMGDAAEITAHEVLAFSFEPHRHHVFI